MEYPPETGWGGIGTYTYELAHGLHRHGIHVDVVSASFDGRGAHYEDDGVAVHRIVAEPFKDSRSLWRLGRLWDGYSWSAAREVRRLAEARNLDVVEGPEARGETLLVTFIGRRRFATVVRLHSDTKTNLCRLFYAVWEQADERLVFTIKADRFLRNMVRALVGTMTEVGSGKMTLKQFGEIIEAKDRCKAGKSAPAKGLMLIDIEYPESIFIN